jgi:hypothetical protein
MTDSHKYSAEHSSQPVPVSGTIPPSSLAFPVLVISKASFSVRGAVEDLTDVWKMLIKAAGSKGASRGFVRDELRSGQVRELHGVRSFWGYTLRYGRKVRVELELQRAGATRLR